MTTQCVTLNDGATGFPGGTATTDLIDILDTVDVPIVVLRRDFILVCFNKAAGGVLRLSPSDIGRASRDISVLAGLPRLEEQCSQVIASGVESRADCRDGDKWFVVRISPYTSGDRQVTGTVLSFTNVTAFRASIDQVIYERECTKAILNTVADPLVVLSGDQHIQSGNRAFYTMFFELASLRTQLNEMLAGSHAFQPVEVDHVFPGEAQRLSLTGSFSWRVTTDEITWSDQLYRIFEFDQGMPVTLELIGTRVHPEDIPLLHDMIERARGAGTDFEYELRLQMPDQSIKYLHTVAHGTRDQDGRLEYIGAVQDVTAGRLSEQALGKAQSELAHVARVATLSTLTASIAHEVNQPLSGIITNASTCLRMLDADPPNVAGARVTAQRTLRDGNRASDVITRLRALFGKQ